MPDARNASVVSAIAQSILRERKLPGLATLSVLYTGRLNTLFAVSDDLVLKLFLAGAAEERRDLEKHGLDGAYAAGVAVPEVIASGITERLPWLLARRAAGVDARTSAALERSRDTRIARAIGHQLRQIHRLSDASTVLTGRDDKGNVAELLRAGAGALATLPRHAPLARALSASVTTVAEEPAAGLSYGWLHGDFQDKNIVIHEGSITAIVDFEHVRRGWRHSELILENICCYGTFSDAHAAALQEALFDGYGLSAAEREVIRGKKNFFRAVALLEALLPHTDSLGALADAGDDVNTALERLAAELNR